MVIFGGGSGIGLAAARLASQMGDRVTIADSDATAAQLAIVTDGHCGFAVCDVTDPTQVKRALAEASAHSRLDAVVTTVGGAQVRRELALDLDYWACDLMFNLTSAYVVATAAIEVMSPHGAGCIVTTSSSFAVQPGPDRIAYSAAKAGVIGLTRSLAAATARLGIRVNCVAPGLTDTPRVRSLSGTPDAFKALELAKPLGRAATAEDVAQAILFLASDAAASMTGQVIHVNSGSYMP